MLGFDGKLVKNNLVQWSGMLSYVILLIMRIPLSKVIGNIGIACFAPAFEIYFVVSILVSYSIAKAMTSMVRYRVKREQYQNARKVLRQALLLSLGIAIIIALVVLVAAEVIATDFIMEGNARLPIKASIVCIILSAVLGSFRGFFSGFGLSSLTAITQYMESILMFVGAMIGGKLQFGYGKKVAALLQMPEQANAYGAMGAIFGMAVAQIIVLLYCLVMYGVYSGYFRGSIGEERARKLETGYSILQILVGNSIPMAIVGIIINGALLVDQHFYNLAASVSENEINSSMVWGFFYGKVMPVIGVATVVVCASVYAMIGKIANAFMKDEYKYTRDVLGRSVRKLCMFAFPLTAFMAVLADTFNKIMSETTETDLAGMFMSGSILILAYSVAFLFVRLMVRLSMSIETIVSLAVCYVLHILLAFVFVQKMNMGINGVIYAMIAFYGLMAVSSAVLVSRYLKYRQKEWIRSVGFPAAAACVSALIVMLIAKVLLPVAGGVVTLAVSLLLGVFVHIILLTVLRVVSEHELERIPFGELFITLGKMMGVM